VRFAAPLAELIEHLEKLPGIGPKSAQRMGFHILRMPSDDVRRFAAAMLEARQSLRLCLDCQNFSAEERCPICMDSRREAAILCVVADPRDVAAVERTHEFKGRYHVLHGLMNPLEGIGPEDLKVKELLSRIEPGLEEVILATNPTVEGDATALYLARLIKPLGLKVTRLAHGMPIGGELDYADSATLHSAFEYRREMA
jgi:recombination protein RecR